MLQRDVFRICQAMRKIAQIIQLGAEQSARRRLASQIKGNELAAPTLRSATIPTPGEVIAS